MTASPELFAALSRAYALTAGVPTFHPSVRDTLDTVGGVVRSADEVVAEVVEGELRVAGYEPGAFHEQAHELARDLQALGVTALKLPGFATTDDLHRFIAFLREHVERARADFAQSAAAYPGSVEIAFEGRSFDEAQDSVPDSSPQQDGDQDEEPDRSFAAGTGRASASAAPAEASLDALPKTPPRGGSLASSIRSLFSHPGLGSLDVPQGTAETPAEEAVAESGEGDETRSVEVEALPAKEAESSPPVDVEPHQFEEAESSPLEQAEDGPEPEMAIGEERLVDVDGIEETAVTRARSRRGGPSHGWAGVGGRLESAQLGI